MNYSYPTRHCHTTEYTASPETVRAARKAAVQSIKDWGLLPLIDTVELLVSELVTNAVRAVGLMALQANYSDLNHFPCVMVQLRVEHDRLFILAWDGNSSPPTPKQAREDDEGGRGLQLVEALSQSWGYYIPNIGGKVVWCQLAL